MPASSPWRALAPDGVSYLPADRCAGHPAARGRAEVPFLWAVGRVGRTSGRRAVRELDLLATALAEAGIVEAEWAAIALDYAASLFADAPDTRSRLSGAPLRRFMAERAAAR